MNVLTWFHDRPAARSRAIALATIVAGSLAIALASRLRIDLPFSPVPITLQTAIVVLVGATLGARRGAIAVALYLAQGLAGAPVFAGGASGLAYAIGPTGGFLVGFLVAAIVAGWLVESGRFTGALGTLAAFALAMIAVYLTGVPWLAAYIGVDRAIAAGLLPFIPGDLVKLVGAAALWQAGTRLTRPR